MTRGLDVEGLSIQQCHSRCPEENGDDLGMYLFELPDSPSPPSSIADGTESLLMDACPMCAVIGPPWQGLFLPSLTGSAYSGVRSL